VINQKQHNFFFSLLENGSTIAIATTFYTNGQINALRLIYPTN